MDSLLVAILIALIPVVITIISSRLYNVIHGLITFLVMGYVLVFCLEVFGANLPAEVQELLPTTCGLYISITSTVQGWLSGVALFENPYIVLAVYVVVFVISQIIACAIRKARVERIKLLRRQVKRY